LRLVVWLRRAELDRQLARRPGLGGSAPLRERAEQLVQPRVRSALADRLEDIVDGAGRNGPVRPAFAPDRAALAIARVGVLQLAAALRTLPEPSPHGVAMTVRLLSDDLGPLFTPASPLALLNAVDTIIVELQRTSAGRT
jgi:hypothetical protein